MSQAHNQALAQAQTQVFQAQAQSQARQLIGLRSGDMDEVRNPSTKPNHHEVFTDKAPEAREPLDGQNVQEHQRRNSEKLAEIQRFTNKT